MPRTDVTPQACGADDDAVRLLHPSSAHTAGQASNDEVDNNLNDQTGRELHASTNGHSKIDTKERASPHLPASHSAEAMHDSDISQPTVAQRQGDTSNGIPKGCRISTNMWQESSSSEAQPCDNPQELCDRDNPAVELAILRPACVCQTRVMASATQPCNSAEQRLPGHNKPFAPKLSEAISHRHVAVLQNTGAPLEEIDMYATCAYGMCCSFGAPCCRVLAETVIATI